MNPTQSKAEPMKQHVKYVGPKDTYTLQFPIPFESKSAAEGDPIQCKRDTPVALSPAQAAQLCKVAGDVFKMCDENGKGLRA